MSLSKPLPWMQSDVEPAFQSFCSSEEDSGFPLGSGTVHAQLRSDGQRYNRTYGFTLQSLSKPLLWLQSDVRTLLGFKFSLLLLLAMLAAEMDTVSPGKMWSAQCRVATVSVISWSTTTAGTELSATGSLDPPLLSLPARRSGTDTTRHS